MRLPRAAALAATVVASVALLTACAQKETPAASSPSGSSTDACANISTVTDGTLTVGTSNPAYPPYVIDNKPSNGKGFEAATAYAVAKEMGFSADQVKWVYAPFQALFAPGQKNYDFALNQISITPKRERAVTFSDPYYTAANAVLVLNDSKYADASSVADLKDAKFGVQINTTGQSDVESVVAPTQSVAVFQDTTAGLSALKNGQIDAFVTDLPTALYNAAVNVPGTVVGQFPVQEQGAEQWGLAMQKDNPLEACVNQALTTLNDNGELQQITDKWMSEYSKAPVLS